MNMDFLAAREDLFVTGTIVMVPFRFFFFTCQFFRFFITIIFMRMFGNYTYKLTILIITVLVVLMFFSLTHELTGYRVTAVIMLMTVALWLCTREHLRITGRIMLVCFYSALRIDLQRDRRQYQCICCYKYNNGREG